MEPETTRLRPSVAGIEPETPRLRLSLAGWSPRHLGSVPLGRIEPETPRIRPTWQDLAGEISALSLLGMMIRRNLGSVPHYRMEPETPRLRPSSSQTTLIQRIHAVCGYGSALLYHVLKFRLTGSKSRIIVSSSPGGRNRRETKDGWSSITVIPFRPSILPRRFEISLIKAFPSWNKKKNMKTTDNVFVDVGMSKCIGTLKKGLTFPRKAFMDLVHNCISTYYICITSSTSASCVHFIAYS